MLAPVRANSSPPDTPPNRGRWPKQICPSSPPTTRPTSRCIALSYEALCTRSTIHCWRELAENNVVEAWVDKNRRASWYQRSRNTLRRRPARVRWQQPVGRKRGPGDGGPAANRNGRGPASAGVGVGLRGQSEHAALGSPFWPSPGTRASRVVDQGHEGTNSRLILPPLACLCQCLCPSLAGSSFSISIPPQVTG